MSTRKAYARKPAKKAYAKRTTVSQPARKPAPKKPVVEKVNPAPGMLSTGGQMLGGALFGPAGAAIGKAAGGLISTLTGFGDYDVVANTLHPALPEGDVPQIVNSGNRGGVIIRHREYIGDLLANIGFQQSQYFLNPGVPASFPWLSNIAAAYEEYEFRGLVYEFKSLSSDSVLSSSTSSALGYVCMATQYNAASPPFVDKHELDNYEYANSRKPSESFCHAVECKRRLNFDTHLYIRSGAVPAGQDQKTFDLGSLSVAVGGCQASSGVLGELWCTYEVEFFHPKYKYNAETLSDHFQRITPTAANPLGLPTATGVLTGSNFGCVVSNTNIAFPVFATGGLYLVQILWSGTVAVGINYPTVTYNNCTAKQFWINDTASQMLSPAPGTSTTAMCYAAVINPTPGAIVAPILTFQTSGGVFPAGTQGVDIWITEMSPSIVA